MAGQRRPVRRCSSQTSDVLPLWIDDRQVQTCLGSAADLRYLPGDIFKVVLAHPTEVHHESNSLDQTFVEWILICQLCDDLIRDAIKVQFKC